MLWEVDVHPRDAAAPGLLAAGRELGLDLTGGRAATGWLIEGDLDRETVTRLAERLLTDPVTEFCRVAPVDDPALLAPPQDAATGTPESPRRLSELPEQTKAPEDFFPGKPGEPSGGLVLHVLPKPGVTDPAAESAREAMALLGIHATAVRSLRKYWLPAGVTAEQATQLAWKRLASEAIHEVVIGGLRLTTLAGGGRWSLVRETVPLDGLDDAALETVSRQRCLALTAAELRAVRDHFAALGRPPFEIELETIAQTWSEHCCHKTLGSPIDHEGPDGAARYDNLLKETVFAATQTVRQRLGSDDWCVSVFRDNSGVVRFDGDHDICVKVETHNHPSAIEPYGGAATGLGGVIRDVLGTGHGAKPLASLDVFCVAPLETPAADIPPGVIPPARLLDGVVAGVRDYGNRMGIPTIAGAVAFHPGYLGNPLVFCGTVGIMPRDSADGRVEPGDLVVVAGGRTGRDGIHGATFSSVELSSDSETESGGSVQIGHAIHEKTVTDFVLAAAEQRLFHAITDCGAGGLSSAVGEMGAELGAEVELDAVPLKYAGLSATEVWISEAQERMVLAVAPADWPRLAEIARQEGTEATAIGRFTGDGRLVLRWEGQTVGDLDCHFLHEGRPRRRLSSRYTPPVETPQTWSLAGADLGAVVLKLLGAADVASKEWIIRQYDHEVQGLSVLKPLLGPAAGPADATVIRGVAGRPRGIVLGVGLRHHLGPLDPYQMAVGGIVEAVANCIAAGADPARIALLDNFCWGDCRRPESLGTLVEACRGCEDAAIALAAPFVSGKDSLNNVFTWTDAAGRQQERSIPPTLLATAMGQIADVGHCLSPDLKQSGNRLAIIGLSGAELAGSQLAVLGLVAGGRVPRVDLAGCRQTFAGIHRLSEQRLLVGCHDLSDGGLAAALAEMAIGSGLGADIDLAVVPRHPNTPSAAAGELASLLTLAATETPGRFLCEVPECAAEAFAAACDGLPWAWLGRVTDDGRLTIRAGEAVAADLPVDALAAAWRGPSHAHAGACG